MKLMNSVILFAGFAVPFAASAAPHWRTAHVTDIQVLESSPVQYDVVYEQRCDDTAAQAIKLVTPTEVVLGVAVNHDPTFRCSPDQPIVSLQKLRVQGANTDPAALRPLN